MTQRLDQSLALSSPFQDVGAPAGAFGDVRDPDSDPGPLPDAPPGDGPVLRSAASIASIQRLGSLRTLASGSVQDPDAAPSPTAILDQPSSPPPPRSSSLLCSMSSVGRHMYPLGGAPSATPPEQGATPPEFVCPITQELMEDPVVLETGQTYERSAIIKWLDSGDAKDPVTGQRINRTIIVPNLNLKNAIQAYKQSCGKLATPSASLGACASAGTSATVPEDDVAPHSDQDPLGKAARVTTVATQDLLGKARGADTAATQAALPPTLKYSPLLEAAVEGDAAAVRALVEGGDTVDGTDWVGDTALHVAARKGHVGVVEALLGLGADCGVENTLGVTPFALAAAEGHSEVLEVMLAAGANASQCGSQGRRTALHHAALTGQQAALAVLLDACPAGLVDAEDDSGCTPLLLATKFGHEAAAAQLIEAGADFLWRVERESGLTALHYACQAGCIGMVKQMLSKRKGRSSRKGKATPLMLAVQSGSEECVRLLLETGGAEVNAMVHGSWESALGCAVQGGMEGMVRMLLEAGADVGLLRWMRLVRVPEAILMMLLEARVGGAQMLAAPAGDSNWHPLLDAVDGRNEKLVRHLMELGCSTLVVGAILDAMHHPQSNVAVPQSAAVLRELLAWGVPEDEAWVALVAAMRRRDEEAVELLLPHVQDLDRVRGGVLLLGLAVELDEPALVQQVLAAGASVNARKRHGRAAVHSLGKNVEVLRVLVEAGADVNAVDNNDTTPLMLETIDAAMTRALVAAGADVEKLDKSGVTALMRARGSDTTQVLVEAGANISAITCVALLRSAITKGDLSKLEYLLSQTAVQLLMQGTSLPASLVQLAASESGSLPVVKFLLAADPVALHLRQPPLERSLLHLAAEQGSMEVARYLVEQGLDVGVPDAAGTSPVQLACANEHWTVASFLLTMNPCGFWESPEEAFKLLLLGLSHQNEEFTCAVLEEAGSLLPVLLHEHMLDTDEGNLPCLHWAAAYGMPRVVAAMLQAGADPNLAAEDGRTALHWVMPLQGRGRSLVPEALCARLLLAAGAKLDAQDVEGHTPLHKAVVAGSNILGELLIHSTVEDHAITMYHRDGFTPFKTMVELALKPGLHAKWSNANPRAMAQACQVAEHLALLRRRQPAAAEKVDAIVNARDHHRMTAADIVVKYNTKGSSNGYHLLRWLLLAGADPLLADPAGNTLLHLVQQNCSVDMCRLVARHVGGKVDVVNAKGETPLYLAAGSPGKMRVLLELGASVRHQNAAGWTPLHCAVVNGSMDGVQALLEAGAEVWAAAQDGVTPLQLAAGPEACDADCLALLLNAGRKDPRWKEDLVACRSLLAGGMQVRAEDLECIMMLEGAQDMLQKLLNSSEGTNLAAQLKSQGARMSWLLQAGAEALPQTGANCAAQPNSEHTDA